MSKYKSKPTKQNGIQFKSRLEKTCYELLTKEGIPFNYEEKKFVLLPTTKCTFDSYERVKRKGKNEYTLKSSTVPKISYKPDFVGDNWIMETKGYETDAFKLKWKMFKKYLEENESGYTLFKPHNKNEIMRSIEIIKNLNDNGHKEEDRHSEVPEGSGGNEQRPGRSIKGRRGPGNILRQGRDTKRHNNGDVSRRGASSRKGSS